MLRRGCYFVALLLTAWTMGLEFAHVLEWAPKSRYRGPLYARLQESLYVWFGNLGGVLYVLAILASVTLAVLLRRDHRARWLVGSAAGLEILALVTFFAVVYPVNLRFPVGAGATVPDDWMALRDRWELGHTIGFVLFTAAFMFQLVAVLRRCAGSTTAVA